jgi:hypothetical protein
LPGYFKPTPRIRREHNLFVFLFPDKIPLYNRIRIEVAVPVYLLINLSYVKYTAFDTIPKGFVLS